MTLASADRARASVFCAVWHRDPARRELVLDHQACLAAQDVAVHPVYVLDAGDEPPPGLRGTIAVAEAPLTIYAAWNVATQLAGAPYVMNLNLDDRLEPQAVGVLARFLDDEPSTWVVGGDWEVRHTQRETDRLSGSLRDVSGLPYDPTWPPRRDRRTRLGSGTGERGTLGPATMWRRELLDDLVFPWQFGGGDPIRVVGDVAWWRMVAKVHGMEAIGRVPLLVGNYHSHPDGQAEFRHRDERDRLVEGLRQVDHPLDGVRVEQRP